MKVAKVQNSNNLGYVKRYSSEKKSTNYNYKQTDKLSNIYYQPVNFTHKWSEHQSWGVTLNDDGSSSAKLFTFPDTKNVSILLNEDTQDKKTLPLANKGNGVFQSNFDKGVIKEGDLYNFVIEHADGSIDKVKDPYSFSQPTLMGPSKVYNHSRFNWSDDNWYSSDNKNRISRRANSKNGLAPIQTAKIYELNIATLTKDGNFVSAKEELGRIKSLGFNAIEIMPVENTYSYNWGYDGVDKLAPSEYLGGADNLKDLINEAHNNGLNVIMDIVPNHLGQDGAQLQRTGPYIKGSTDWGDAFNYEGENSQYVRDYIANVALNWLNNYHCDGLRLDMTKFMHSDSTMQQIAAEVNQHFPDAFLIAEDGRSNISVHGNEYWNDCWQPYDQRVIRPLDTFAQASSSHEEFIQKIADNEISLSSLGFDSEWDFNFYHILTQVAYGGADLDALERAVVDSSKRIKYSASHDEIGNLDGTRPVAKFLVPLLRLDKFVELNNDDFKRVQEYVDLKNQSGGNFSWNLASDIVRAQKIQQISMKLVQLLQTSSNEELMSYSQEEFNKKILAPLGIKEESGISPQSLLENFEKSTSIYRSIEALRYFAPGPIMTFQGEENLASTKFNFFRQFQSIEDEHYLEIQKGYKNGLDAFMQSKLNGLKYSSDGIHRMSDFQNLIIDLNDYKAKNKASSVGRIVMEDTIKHPQNPTIAFHAIDDVSKNETFVISNFSNEDYPIYNIEFPKGRWHELINTNHIKYGGSGTCQNENDVIGLGANQGKKIKSKIALPANSTVIFKKVSI